MHDGIYVVRDDRVPGGTKQRVLEILLPEIGPGEYVYAAPQSGFAQLALAYACKRLGPKYKATVFMAGRRSPHQNVVRACEAGAKIVTMPENSGMMSVVKARARAYAHEVGAYLLPWGLDWPEFRRTLAELARSVPYSPQEVWSVAGSGVLTRSLQAAWPDAEFNAVNVSIHKVNAGRAKVWQAPEKFDADAKLQPPFPSVSNYDAKAWQFIVKHASRGALFWNVAG